MRPQVPAKSKSQARRSAQRLRDDERGTVAASVVMFPVVMAAVMLAIQGALVFHARSLVQTAAQDAARVTQVEEGTVADGEAAAGVWLGGGGLLENPVVSISRGATQVEVTVTSGVQSLVPFWNPSVTATVSGPVEVFRPENERP